MTALTTVEHSFVLDVSILADRQEAGKNYIAVGTADIDGEPRSYAWILGRDY